MNQKTQYITKAAVIAAVYVALTALSRVFGLADGSVQFRLSEALTILPIFCPAAIPGLTVGCLLANITSTLDPLDMVFGTLATLLACLVTYAARKVTVKGFPPISFLSPVVFNGLIVGAEIAFLYEKNAAVFLPSAGLVAAGEAAVVFVLGTVLFFTIQKNEKLKALLR